MSPAPIDFNILNFLIFLRDNPFVSLAKRAKPSKAVLSDSGFFDGGKGVNWKEEYIMEHKFWKGYVSNFCDFNQMKMEYIQMVFSLQSVLQNCNYLFYNNFDDTIISLTDENIDFTRWVKPRTSFDGYLNKFKPEEIRLVWNDKENLYDDHPNELGHKKWFECIDSRIQIEGIL